MLKVVFLKVFLVVCQFSFFFNVLLCLVTFLGFLTGKVLKKVIQNCCSSEPRFEFRFINSFFNRCDCWAVPVK